MNKGNSFLGTALAASVLAFGFVGGASLSAKPRVEVRASVGFQLPHGAVQVSVGSDRYHYHRGVFYQRGRHGYVRRPAPRGAVVRSLPRGYVRVVIGSDIYYRFDGVYYTHSPTGYVVVDAPKKVKVLDTEEDV